jgi:hypothetical protein
MRPLHMDTTRRAGYARIAATLYSFHIAFKHPIACVALYFFG